MIATAVATTENQSPELAAIRMSVAELEQQLLANDPQMPQYLKRIHAALLTHTELTHLLKDEERAVIIAGLSKLTDVIITVAEKKTVAKKLASHTVDDI